MQSRTGGFPTDELFCLIWGDTNGTRFLQNKSDKGVRIYVMIGWLRDSCLKSHRKSHVPACWGGYFAILGSFLHSTTEKTELQVSRDLTGDSRPLSCSKLRFSRNKLHIQNGILSMKPLRNFR